MELQQEIPNEVLGFIDGGGEMGALTRTFNWADTSLGEPYQWPASLRTTLGIVLHSAFPMFLFWGDDLICFYNDAFRPSLGVDGKHPAIGKKGKDVWSEIWNFIGPLIHQVMSTGKPVWFEDQLVPFYRNGRMEDIFWTFSYSPAYGDDGNVAGVFVTCTETTEKVLNSAKLSRSEQNLRNTILKAPVAMCIMRGRDHVVEIANDRMIDLWGKTPGDVLNKPLIVGLPEIKDQGFIELLDSVFATGKPYAAHAAPVALPRNGKIETIYVNFIYEAFSEPDGSIGGIIAVAVDVSEQVVARKRVEESEQRVRSVVDSAPFPIGVYTGREMRIEIVNQSIIDVWGKGNNIVGKLYSEVLPELENQLIYQQLDGVYTTGIPFHARNQRVDLVVDGRLQPFYFNYSFTPLFDSEGKVYGVMNTAADVTDLNVAKQKAEQGEKNLRSMVLQAPVAMCILIGTEHIVEVANELMLELWGKSREDVLRKPLFEGLPDAKEQGLEKLLDNVYETGETFKANERPVELVRNGKREIVYQSFVYEPYRGGDGAILGVLVISVDVTEQVLARRKIEEAVATRTQELASVNNYLQRSNAELAQFAYIASHDLQEPVRKVSTYTQMLTSHLGKVDERASNYLHKIKNSSSRMLALIRDVLAYSELSNVSDHYTEVNLQEVIKDIQGDFELLIEQKNAKIVATDLPTIEAIPLHMSQLFGNLISNALKFSRIDVHPKITITSSLASKEELTTLELDRYKRHYKIEVADNGIGFNPEHAAQIFNIFQRLHGKQEYEGTGIGLALCRKIVQNHYGKIYAIPEPGKGSRFVIVLPEKQLHS